MNVFNEVKKVICKIQPGIDEEKIAPQARLKEDLEVDSLSKVEMALAIEEALDLTLQDAELDDIETVDQVVELVESKLKVRDA